MFPFEEVVREIRAAVCDLCIVIVVNPVIPFIDPAVLVVVEPVDQEQELGLTP